MTINVWSGLTYEGSLSMARHADDDPEHRYGLLVAGLREVDPDIIALQEANPLPDYAERLAADLGCLVAYRVALGGIRLGPVGLPDNLREGGAILVRKDWTLTDLGREHLGGCGVATNFFCFHFSELTQAILGRVVMNGKPLYIYAVHLYSSPFRPSALDASLESLRSDWPPEEIEAARRAAEADMERRKRDIARLVEFIEETLPPGMPAIILGDFNTTPESGELDALLANGAWVDSHRWKHPAVEGFTWDPLTNPNFREADRTPGIYHHLKAEHARRPARLDLILVRGNIPAERILESRVILTPEDGLAPSDHYGVLTTLRW